MKITRFFRTLLLPSLLFPIIAVADTNSTHVLESSDESEPAPTEQDNHQRSWLISPLVVANPSFGNGGGAIGMYFFNTEKGNTNNPASAITAVGMYSDTDSYFLGLFGQTFWKQDTLRVTGGVAHPKIKHEFNINSVLNDVRFTTQMLGLFTRVDKRVYGDWFIGVKAFLMDMNYKDPNNQAKVYFQLFEVEDSTSGQLGLVASYDSRDHVRYPTSGNQSELGWMTVPEEWGATESYSVTEGFSNQYFRSLTNRCSPCGHTAVSPPPEPPIQASPL